VAVVLTFDKGDSHGVSVCGPSTMESTGVNSAAKLEPGLVIRFEPGCECARCVRRARCAHHARWARQICGCVDREPRTKRVGLGADDEQIAS
jgi:hypothetical protein